MEPTAGRVDEVQRNTWRAVAAWVVSFSLMAIAGALAAKWVGYLFGWIAGASLSPVGAVVAPLVFGLLAVIGVRTAISNDPPESSLGVRCPSDDELATASMRMIRIAITAVGVWIFSTWCYTGIQDGALTRNDPLPYPEMSSVMAAFGAAPPSVEAEVYALRWRMLKAGLDRAEFGRFARDVINPILADRKSPPEEMRAKIAALAESLPK